MEIVFTAIIVIIIIFITCSICGYCCKRNKQGIVYGVATQPTVTTTGSHTAYNIGPPPQTGAPLGGFAPHAAYPPVAPYPNATPYPPASMPPGYPSMPMPMPVTGDFSGVTPYPPMPMPGTGAYTAPVPPYPSHTPGANQLPPSYAEAVTQPPPTNEVYAKQSPYNPNFN